jgi:hypothetical protein
MLLGKTNMINIQSALNPKQSYQITLGDPKAVQLFRYYLKYNSSKCDPFYDSPVLFQKAVHHVKVTSSVIWNHLQNNFKNKKTNSTRKNKGAYRMQPVCLVQPCNQNTIIL